MDGYPSAPPYDFSSSRMSTCDSITIFLLGLLPCRRLSAVVSFYAIFRLPRESHGSLFRTIHTLLALGGRLPGDDGCIGVGRQRVRFLRWADVVEPLRAR